MVGGYPACTKLWQNLISQVGIVVATTLIDIKMYLSNFPGLKHSQQFALKKVLSVGGHIFLPIIVHLQMKTIRLKDSPLLRVENEISSSINTLYQM